MMSNAIWRCAGRWASSYSAHRSACQTSRASFAIAGGDTHIRAATAVAWAALAPTRRSRDARLSDVVRLSRFLRAEDLAHEVPPVHLFKTPRPRPAPYIYTQEELVRILEVAGALRRQKPSPLRRETYVMLIGLLAATGLRISEALNLRLCDLLPGGILRIGETKFGASRLVPMHKTVAAAFDWYLEARDRFAGRTTTSSCRSAPGR
jgi:integrase/recombinase XerD